MSGAKDGGGLHPTSDSALEVGSKSEEWGFACSGTKNST